MTKLSTYPHRSLTDREVLKLLSWIPIQLIALLGSDNARKWMEIYLLPTSRGEAPTEEMIAGLPLPPSNLIPFFTSAAVNAFVDYQANAVSAVSERMETNPVEAAFLWILDHWDHYIALAQELNTFTEQHLQQQGKENGTEKKNQDN